MYKEILEKAFSLYKKRFWQLIIFLLVYYLILGGSLIVLAIPLIGLLIVNPIIAGLYIIFALVIAIHIYSLNESAFYSFITLCIQNKRFYILDAFRKGKEKMFSFLGAFVLAMLILAIPTITFIITLVCILSYYLPNAVYYSQLISSPLYEIYVKYSLGILTLFIISLISLIYLKIRIFFYIPFIFLKNDKAVESIKNTLSFTSKHFKKSLILYVILALVGVALGILSEIPGLGIFITLFFTAPYLRFALFLGFIEISKDSKTKSNKKVKKGKRTKTKRKR